MLDHKLPIPHSPSHNVLDGSKLNRFMECPRAFFYEYMLGWRSERPNNHLVFGTAWHEAIEHLMKNGYSQTDVMTAFDKFMESYRSVFTDPNTDDLFFPKTPDRAFECLAGYAVKWGRSDPINYEVLYTEIAFTIQMDDTRHLCGRMDSIVRLLNTLKIGSLEHKTFGGQRNWGDQFHMCMQGSLYTHVLMCLYRYENVGPIIFNGAAFLKNKGTRGGKKFDYQREVVKKSKAQMQTWYLNTLYWMDQVENEYRLLSEQSDSLDVMTAFPMNTTNCTKWFGCAYRDFCNSWKNPLQKCFAPPLGMIEEHWNPLDEEAKVTMSVGVDGETTITEND